jgi:hypothetical protein
MQWESQRIINLTPIAVMILYFQLFLGFKKYRFFFVLHHFFFNTILLLDFINNFFLLIEFVFLDGLGDTMMVGE